MNADPQRWTPHVVPQARRDYLATLRRMADQVRALPEDAHASAELDADVTAIRMAELYWVTQDMTRLALAAAADLPEWTPSAAAPTGSGIIGFQEPLPPVSATGQPTEYWPRHRLFGHPVPPKVAVAAVRWSLRGGRLHLTALGRTADLLAALPRYADAPWRDSPWWDMASAQVDADAPIQDLQETFVTDVNGNPITDMPPTLSGLSGLVSTVAAAWLMMMEPKIAQRRTVVPQRKVTRRKSTPDSPVTLIDLRALRQVDIDPVDESGRVYRHRWVVRGHWRQQAFGPDRSQRKPLFIAPYIKGPAGAPLLATEHVHVWRR